MHKKFCYFRAKINPLIDFEDHPLLQSLVKGPAEVMGTFLHHTFSLRKFCEFSQVEEVLREVP